MPFMPFHILGFWFRGLLSVAIIAGSVYLLARWYDTSHVVITEPTGTVGAASEPEDRGRDPGTAQAGSAPSRRVFRFEPGWNRPTAYLASGLALLIWATLGRPIFGGVSTLIRGSKPTPAAGKDATTDKASTASPGDSADDPHADRTGTVHRIARPDGSELRVECYGLEGAPAIVFSHGWGSDSTGWYYVKKTLAGRFRLILWDEPGMGLSKKPDNNDFRMEKLAEDLHAVLALAGDRPAILVGHSIGGMLTLTFCRRYPEALGRRVAGLVLVHTTYRNPVRTTKGADLLTAIEKPILIPLMYLTIATWPIAWLMSWLNYFNGSAHRSTHKTSFANTETRGQLDFCARFMPKPRPDVLARGMLGMIAYDETATLATINVPTLVVVGDLDTTTPPEAGQFMARTIPDAEIATLAPARHFGLIERNAAFDALLGRFADAHLSSRAVG